MNESLRVTLILNEAEMINKTIKVLSQINSICLIFLSVFIFLSTVTVNIINVPNIDMLLYIYFL